MEVFAIVFAVLVGSYICTSLYIISIQKFKNFWLALIAVATVIFFVELYDFTFWLLAKYFKFSTISLIDQDSIENLRVFVRGGIEELSRVFIVVLILMKAHSINRHLLIIKVASLIALLEASLFLIPFIQFSYFEVAHVGQNVVYELNNNFWQNIRYSPSVLIAVGFSVFSKLVLHYLLGAIGIHAWFNDKKPLVPLIVIVHSIHNYILNILFYSDIQTPEKFWMGLAMQIFIILILSIMLIKLQQSVKAIPYENN